MKEENVFWILCKYIGCIVLTILILTIPYKLGEQNGKKSQTQTIGIMIPEEPCEYNSNGLYFKGSCGDVHSLIGIELRRIDFDKYIKNIKESFNNNCKDFFVTNMYHNAKEKAFDEDIDYWGNVSFEEFKEVETIKLIANLSCDIEWR